VQKPIKDVHMNNKLPIYIGPGPLQIELSSTPPAGPALRYVSGSASEKVKPGYWLNEVEKLENGETRIGFGPKRQRTFPRDEAEAIKAELGEKELLVEIVE
jgi:hypothetical protein